MRLALGLSALFSLAACGSEPSSPDVAANPPSDPAPALFTVADLEGDWVYCSGPSSLDTDVTFEGERVSTYINGRPGQLRDYTLDGTDLVVGDSRFSAGVAGSVLTLTTDDSPAVYARSASACPVGNAPSLGSGTTCYRNEIAYDDRSGLMDVEELTVEVDGNQATGTYNWLPAEKDTRRGSFEGTAEGSTIQATYRFEQEGVEDMAQIQIDLEDDRAVVSGGAQELGLAATLPQADC